MANFWFKRIGGKIDKGTDPWTYSGGDISRIEEVPPLWREQVRAIIESM